MGEDIDWEDPILVDLNATDRSNCSSIADNKIHGTYPDALIGPTQTVLVSHSWLRLYIKKRYNICVVGGYSKK